MGGERAVVVAVVEKVKEVKGPAPLLCLSLLHFCLQLLPQSPLPPLQGGPPLPHGSALLGLGWCFRLAQQKLPLVEHQPPLPQHQHPRQCQTRWRFQVPQTCHPSFPADYYCHHCPSARAPPPPQGHPPAYVCEFVWLCTCVVMSGVCELVCMFVACACVCVQMCVVTVYNQGILHLVSGVFVCTKGSHM